MKRKKGFTLIELIIVLAIIAVFSAVLVPSWMTYIRKTRLKTADGRARTIFNAAQTVALKYQATERNASSAYLSNGDFYYCWEDGKGYKCDSSWSADSSVTDDQNAAFGSMINRIFSEDGCYKLHIVDYKVKSVYYTQSKNYRYPGSYPVTMSTIYRQSGGAGILSDLRKYAFNPALDQADNGTSRYFVMNRFELP